MTRTHPDGRGREDEPGALEIGRMLEQARERRRLDYAEIEAATRIPSRLLVALERERFDRFPAPFYCRSFLREYAEFLGLDADAYVHELDLREATRPAPPRAGGRV